MSIQTQKYCPDCADRKEHNIDGRCDCECHSKPQDHPTKTLHECPVCGVESENGCNNGHGEGN